MSTADLIAEARSAAEYLDAFDARRKVGGHAAYPALPVALAEKTVQGTIRELADALEAATAKYEYHLDAAVRLASEAVDLEDKLAPRVVSTVAELDALPDASVIREPLGITFAGVKRMDGKNWWLPSGYDRHDGSAQIGLPATVLWVGGTE